MHCRFQALQTSLCSLTLAIGWAGVTTLCHATAGQPGTLDPFWANGSALGSGKLITMVDPRGASASSMVVLADGRVLVAGSCRGSGFCAARYNSNGAIDTSFGNAGLLPPINLVSDAGSAFLAPLADGRVLLAGACTNGTNRDFCLVRLSVTGAQDMSFGVGGVAITPIGARDDTVSAMLLQPDGKIVLVGSCTDGGSGGGTTDFCTARFLPDGQLDLSFASTGKVVSAFYSNRHDRASAVVLQPDGKLVLVGSCEDVNGVDDLCALRYQINGALDSSFGSGGKLVIPVGGSSGAPAVALQADGKLLIAAGCDNGSKFEFCTLRYIPNGTIDTSFGAAGKVITAIGVTYDVATAIALQPDGKVLVAGYCEFGGQTDFCAVRYTAAGALDAAFGTGGKLATAISNGLTPATSNDLLTAMALQPDGKLLLAGSCYSGAADQFCIARYDGGPFPAPACSLDIDGDNQVLATTDSLIHARIALGIRGNAVVAGINFPLNASRKTWAQIRGHLVSVCGMVLPL